jgi:hypothetical protein
VIEVVQVEIPLGFPVFNSQVRTQVVDGRIVVEIVKFTCEQCDQPFPAHSKLAMFCSGACRAASHRKKPKEGN